MAQKNWGYKDAAGTPSPQVLQALQDVDAALGSFLAALKVRPIQTRSLNFNHLVTYQISGTGLLAQQFQILDCTVSRGLPTMKAKSASAES